VRQRLCGIWPQARPVPADDIEAWRWLDANSPGVVPPDEGPPGSDPGGFGQPGFGQPPPRPPGGRVVLGAFDPGRRGVRALALVAVLVVLVAGYLAWRAQPRAEPAPGEVSSSVTTTPDTSGTGGMIVVAVAGRVRHPGLVRLPAGARVQDAIEAAGGVLQGTDVSFVNLARKLGDGELVVIGVSPPPGIGAAGAGGTAGSAGNPAGGKINLNTASLAELDTLPGIGPALAQRIIDYRTAHGGFRSVADLRRVEGIGDSKFAQLKDRVTV
jgi:competence protein ComEA